jgi:addiction module HigA family antidote
MAIRLIHPGEHLAEELKELGMSAAELARNLGVPTNRVTAILNGQRAITGDTALRLAHFFGTSAEFWLNLQSLYELRVAQRKSGKSIARLPKLKRPERFPHSGGRLASTPSRANPVRKGGQCARKCIGE